MVDFLIKNGAKLSTFDENGDFRRSVLVTALKCKNYAAIILLLENGYDLNAQNENGLSLLHWICTTEQILKDNQIFGILNLYQPQWNLQITENKMTPLHVTCKMLNLDALNMRLNIDDKPKMIKDSSVILYLNNI